MLILLTLLVPLVGGALLGVIRPKTDRTRAWYVEAVVIATRTARAVKALARAGKVREADFPLLLHVDALLNNHAALNIPWKAFERED